MKLFRSRVAVAVVCFVFGAGCGGGGGDSKLKLIKVTGKVTFEDKPLSSGTITFVSDAQGGANAAGEISSSGAYSLSTQKKGDGVPAGSYKVRIESWATPPKMDESGVDPGKSAIPDRYNSTDTSSLTATVKDSPASQTVDFRLTP